MAKQTFKNAAISFGGTSYLCISDLTLDTSVSVATSECSTASGNANTFNAIGAESGSVSGTFLAEDDAVTLDTAFTVGTSGALIVYPYGNSAGKASYSWTNAFVASWGLSGNTSSMGSQSVNLTCDGEMTAALVGA